MRSALVFPALAGLVLTAPTPTPQFLDVAAIETSPAVRVSAFLDTTEDVPARMQASAIASVARPDLVRRDDDCAPRPSGYGPVPTPDTADAFRNFTALQVDLMVPSYDSS